MSSPDFIAGGVRFQIYARADRKREGHVICYYIGSRRMRVTVKGDRAAAEKRAKDLSKKITTGEESDGLHLTPLDKRIYIAAKAEASCLDLPVDAIVRQYIAAQRLLGAGVTIDQAAKFWNQQHAGGLKQATVAQVAAELLEHLEGKRRRGVTIQTVKSILKRFNLAFGSTPIAHVRREDIDMWLNSFPRFAPRTVNNHRAAVVRLFHYARGKYLPKEQATAANHVDPVSDDSRGEVQIFRPWEMSKILSTAPDTILPAILLGAFAGLRSIELCRMEWSAIHWDAADGYPHGFIELSKASSKQHRTAARRIITIHPNLAEPLKPYRFKQGPIYAGDQNKLARAITRLIGKINKEQKKMHGPLVGRPKNGLRHSYGSYRLPVLKSVEALRLEMGNSAKEIFENYREVVSPADVAAWWDIYPADGQILFPGILGAAGGGNR